jgi:hypothetical protein
MMDYLINIIKTDNYNLTISNYRNINGSPFDNDHSLSHPHLNFNELVEHGYNIHVVLQYTSKPSNGFSFITPELINGAVKSQYISNTPRLINLDMVEQISNEKLINSSVRYFNNYNKQYKNFLRPIFSLKITK